ncbi:hypothetical protein ACI8AF_06045 [Blastococcus sp. SYSU D00669]
MPSAPVRPGDAVVMSIAPRRSSWFEGGMLGLTTLFLATIGVWLVVAGLWWTLLVSLPVVWFPGRWTVETFRLGNVRLRLTPSQFLVPSGLRGWTAIDVASIAEVYVRHFEGGESFDTWYLHIATTDGRARDVRVDKHQRYREHAPAGDWERLLPRTGHHETAAVLAAHVLALQGPGGPLSP